MIKEIVTSAALLTTKSRSCSFDDLGVISNQNIIQNMLDTCQAHRKGCIGLASNQIGENKRIIVVMLEDKYTPMVNPTFTPVKSDGRKKYAEGCLSFPNRATPILVKRWKTINVTYQLATGATKKVKLGKMAAVIFQHEIDHLNGIYI